MLTLSLQMGDQLFVGRGDTGVEAVEDFMDKLPVLFKPSTKGVLTYSDGEHTKEQYLGPVQLKRLPRPLTKSLLVKQFAFGMK